MKKEKIKNKEGILKYKRNKLEIASLCCAIFALIQFLAGYTLGLTVYDRKEKILHEEGNSKQIVEELSEEKSKAYNQYVDGKIDYADYIFAKKKINSNNNKLEIIRKHVDGETLEEVDKTIKMVKTASVMLETAVVPAVAGIPLAYFGKEKAKKEILKKRRGNELEREL